jgi:hypothetical protein
MIVVPFVRLPCTALSPVVIDVDERVQLGVEPVNPVQTLERDLDRRDGAPPHQRSKLPR